MHSFHLFSFLSFLVLQIYASALPRRGLISNTCTDLHALSNNGNRKIAIVMDSSGSMAESDPSNLRLVAARNVISNWLVSKTEATRERPADLVTVIEFNDTARLNYRLGDPGAASASLGKIGGAGGTLIASGVEMAIEQLMQRETGLTEERSGIIVFTDGEDNDTPALVNQINTAARLGIRVSFGFLSEPSSYQDGEVLAAIMRSGGQYSTVFSAATANSFVNLVLMNGLTANDNPQGSQSRLLSGLSVSRFISGSETVSVTYEARDNEVVHFNVDSVDAGNLDIQAVLDGEVVDESMKPYLTGDLIVTAEKAGSIEVRVKASSASKDSIFTVGAMSNLPAQDCIVGVVESRGRLSFAGQASQQILVSTG